MMRSLLPRPLSMVLAAGLAIASTSKLSAQVAPSGTTGGNLPASSGSGTGTATGSSTLSGGTSATGTAGTVTGSPAGSRIGSEGFGTGERGSPGVPPIGVGRSPNAGPGGGSHMPDDPGLIPLEALQGPKSLELGKMSEVTTINPLLLRRARDISEPGERSLALQRLANAAIFSNELSEAHHALTRAAHAALELEPSLIRDQRVIAIITSVLALAEADLREGKINLIPEIVAPDPKGDRETLIRRARLEWRRAEYLASVIANPTYRAEMAFRVVENEAGGSQTITEYLPDGDPPPKGGESATPYASLADAILQEATLEALVIERPVWRDRALVAVAAAGAASKQFSRALDIARKIPQPEVRTDALIRIAEAQSRTDTPDSATPTYEEAARSVASIPLADPRAVLTGVLIDNLVSVGRFEDARASVSLYPEGPRRLLALGAIAESQGRRGAGDTARAWIAQEPEENRSILYRHVSDGIIAAVEQNRSRAMSGRNEK